MIPEQVHARSLRELLAPIGAYLDDPLVSEILVNGADEVYVERRGRLERTDARFPSVVALLAALRGVAQFVGHPLDAEHPILEGHLPDGSRLQALIAPAAPDGPVVAIRRSREEHLTIERLVELGTLSEAAARALQDRIAARHNVLVSGGTGSGKTSLLGCLSSFIDAAERVVVIEDTPELQLRHPHRVRLEARPADARGRGALTVRELFRATLRLRPDRIVIGELRGGEALELIQAMTSGHGGCLSTIHASHPLDALRRVETLALMSGVTLPLRALREQIASAIQIVVQTTRRGDGARLVTHISEVRPLARDGSYVVADLFRRSPSGSLLHAPTPHAPTPSLTQTTHAQPAPPHPEPTAGRVLRVAEHLPRTAP
jgi:pilus assembly protein CpaF